MRKQRGFTLIELLIVVAIIGIIAAIAIPNLLDAIERSRQKKSVSEVQSLGVALQSFSTDYGGYPQAAFNGDPSVTLGPLNFLEAGPPAGSGTAAFVPDYIQAIPQWDGWGTPYTVDFSAGAPGAVANTRLGFVVATHYTLGSLGNDKGASASPNDIGAAAYGVIAGAWNVAPPALPVDAGTLQTHCYATDIVYGDSSFLQVPEGKQKNC